MTQNQKKIVFIGLSGREYPHTRVRCYNFARTLNEKYGLKTEVLSFKDNLVPELPEHRMYSLRDREHLSLTIRAFLRLLRERNTVFYLQKAHFHAAAPFLLHRLLRRPYIFDYDDYDIPLSNFFHRKIYNRLVFGDYRPEEITFRLARRARRCVASSHFLQDFLKDHNPNVSLVETGVDVRLFTPPEARNPEGPVRFLWNGLIWGEPIFTNVAFLFDCFAEVTDKVQNTELFIVGGGMWMDRVKALIAEKYAGLPIRIREWVKPEEMPAIVRECDVGVLPLIQQEPWYQAKSPTKLYEYLAGGLAVVASPTGEARHIIEPETSGILAENRETFIAGMTRLAADPALREKLSEGARKRAVERYSLDVLGERLFEAIREEVQS